MYVKSGRYAKSYAKDPDGLELEIFWTVPDGTPAGTRPLHLEAELARRAIPLPA